MKSARLGVLAAALLGQCVAAQDHTIVDGTTGVPLGGVGAGAVKFCAYQGTFSFNDLTPTRNGDYQPLGGACFQLFSDRGGTIVTSAKLSAVVRNGRSQDDAIYPTHTADFGIINDVSVRLTAFAPFNLSSNDAMANPHACYEIEVSNTLPSSVDVAIAFNLTYDANPAKNSGKGLSDNASTNANASQKAVYVKASDAAATISYGSDGGFFTTGLCNNGISDRGNRVAAKVTLAGKEAKYVKFVFAWYRNVPDWFNYMNRYSCARDVANDALNQFDAARSNAVAIVSRMRGGNVPRWITDPTLNSLINVVNNGIYTKDGRYCHNEGMYGMCGTMDQRWHARFGDTLFTPELVWRELEYWARTQKANGQIHHDFGNYPAICSFDDTTHADYKGTDVDNWVDLNCGFIISVYEAFILTDDQGKLAGLWPYVKRAAQRLVDQKNLYGDPAYPWTYGSSSCSYDIGEDSRFQMYNTGLAAIAYELVARLAEIQGETSLRNSYAAARSNTVSALEAKWLSTPYATGKYCESGLAGPWIMNCLKIDSFWSSHGLDTLFQALVAYYSPLAKGLGSGGYWNDWQPYLVGHFGGYALQTGRADVWYALQHDMYNRNYLNRSLVFNEQLGVPDYVQYPIYLANASETSGANQYISIPVLWRNYVDLIGYYRNKHTGELWLEPHLPSEMNHAMTQALFVTPETLGTISLVESGTNYQNQSITVVPDAPLAVTAIYVTDRYANAPSVTVNDESATYAREGVGLTRRLRINWSRTIPPSGIRVVVTDAARAPQVFFTPPAGRYTNEQSVALSCDAVGATIRYTVDGSTPTTSSTLYSVPIAVKSNVTITAIAVTNGIQAGDAASARYSIDYPAAVPTFLPGTGACRMKLAFPGYDKAETLTNFPALVAFSNNINNSGFDYGQFASANGWDLRFRDTNEISVLNYEVEQWDNGGISYVWVQVPQFRSNSYIWACWGDASRDMTSAPAYYTTNGATWPTDDKGVWHLNHTGKDSTAYANNGASHGNTNATGLICGAQGFDGSGAYIALPSNGSLNVTNSLTISAWLYANAIGGWAFAYSAGWSGWEWKCDYGATINNKWGVEVRAPNQKLLEGGVAVAGQWHQVAFVLDGVSRTEYLYQDGALMSTNSDTGPLASSDTFRIGCKYDSSGAWNGLVDELRVSSAARSSNWLWACYMNQASNASFNAYGRVSRNVPGTVMFIY